MEAMKTEDIEGQLLREVEEKKRQRRKAQGKGSAGEEHASSEGTRARKISIA